MHVLVVGGPGHIGSVTIEELLAAVRSGRLNLGSGQGNSNREVIEAVHQATGLPVALPLTPRRPGDPPKLVGLSAIARAELGWQLRYENIDAIVASALSRRRRHSNGYEGHSAIGRL